VTGETLWAAARVRLRQLALMTAKELRQLWRDRPLAAFIVYIFTVDLLLAAGGGTRDLLDVAVLVHDGDRSAASRELVHLIQPPYFRLKGEVPTAEDGIRRLDAGDAMLLVSIPPGFGETLGRGAEAAHAQLLVDTSRAIRGYLAASYAARIVERLGASLGAGRLARAGGGAGARLRLVNRPRVWYNPGLIPTWFHAISELLTMMTVACIVLPAAALVREKERGTIEQLLVSPLTPFQVMSSKVLAMVLVTVVGTTVALLGVAQPAFGVPVRGSLLLFMALTALYAFTNAGLGLVAGTFARNSGQVGMIVMLIVMPIIMLSGTWVTLESMPAPLRGVMSFSPLRHFIDIAYGILLRGSGLDVLWRPVLAMTAIGATLFAVGLWRFRRQFE